MINLIIGIALGFFVATYGVSGVAQAVEKSFVAVKNINITVEK